MFSYSCSWFYRCSEKNLPSVFVSVRAVRWVLGSFNKNIVLSGYLGWCIKLPNNPWEINWTEKYKSFLQQALNFQANSSEVSLRHVRTGSDIFTTQSEVSLLRSFQSLVCMLGSSLGKFKLLANCNCWLPMSPIFS